MRSRWSGSAVLIALAAATSLALPSAAPAESLLDGVNETCPSKPLKQPFLRWLDPAHYVLAPGGTIERGSGVGAWTLSGGARAVDGNEAYYVNSRSDSRSLSLPRGASATTPPICVALDYPTMRFFSRSSGLLPLLRVDVLFEGPTGHVSAPIGVATPSGSWQPTLPMVVVANLLAPLPGDLAPVAFRFKAVSGSWSVDDVYVDPKRH